MQPVNLRPARTIEDREVLPEIDPAMLDDIEREIEAAGRTLDDTISREMARRLRAAANR